MVTEDGLEILTVTTSRQESGCNIYLDIGNGAVQSSEVTSLHFIFNLDQWKFNLF